MAVDKLDCPHVVLVVSGVHRKLFKRCVALLLCNAEDLHHNLIEGKQISSICGISIEKNHKKPTDFFFQGA